MVNRRKLSSSGSLILGLFCVLLGTFPVLAAFDIGPLGVDEINGPPWLGISTGLIFVAAGLLVMAGDALPIFRHILALLMVGNMAAISNWVAFGVGERVCTGSMSFFGFLNSGQLSGLECRIPFGFGALVFDAFLIYIFIYFLQRSLGGPPKLARLKKLSENLILLIMAPILVPLFLFLIIRSGLGALKTRLKTGTWPRNRSFIERRKKE